MPNTSSNPPPSPLTSQERSRLRAAAHALNPVVLIGERGLSDAVLKEIDRALAAHQLIKVRAASQDRDARAAMLTDLCAALGCQPVHHLGKMLILYRPAPAAETSPEARPRKASAPYVPKKQAAAGKPVKKPRPRRPQANSELAAKKPRAAANHQAANKPAARKTTAARAGSALSLRAGARSLSRTVGTRKTASRSKPRPTPRSR